MHQGRHLETLLMERRKWNHRHLFYPQQADTNTISPKLGK